MAFLDNEGLAYFWNQVLARLNKFVPAETGKGLSSNDYTTEEKEKLAGIESGANKTIIDSALSSTSTNPVQNKVINTKLDSIQTDIDSKVPSTRTVNGKALSSNITLSASDVGALPDTTQIPSIDGLATETYVDNKVAGLVDSAPATLDTLNELATALGDDPNFATTVATQIGTKVDKVEGKGLSSNDYTAEEKTKLAGIEEGANKTVIDSALSASSTNPVQNKVINTALDSKVDKIEGKGLSTNDYTTTEKNKLAGIADGANKTVVDIALNSTSTNPVQNKIVTASINNLNDLVGGTAVSTQINNAIAPINEDLSFFNCVINVKAYGAKGDGVADDTDAINAALSVGGHIYFPDGLYKVTGQLSALKPGKIIMEHPYPISGDANYPTTGEMNGARIDSYYTGDIGFLVGDSVQVDGLAIRACSGFTGTLLQYDGSQGIRSYPSTSSFNHIYLDTDSNTICPTCMFDFKPNRNYGIKVNNVIVGNKYFRQFATYGIKMDLTESNWANSIAFENITLDIRASYPLFINNGTGSSGSAKNYRFRNITIQASAFDSSYPITTHVNGVYINNVHQIIFDGCKIWDVSSSSFSDGVIKTESCTKVLSSGCDDYFYAVDTEIHAFIESAKFNFVGQTTNVDADDGGFTLSLTSGSNVKTWRIDAKSTSIPTKNRYNPLDPEVSMGYIASAGQINDSNSYWVTGYIPATIGESIYASLDGVAKNYYYIAEYSSKSKSGFLVRNTASTNGYTTTSDQCQYIRVSFKTSIIPYGSERIMIATDNDFTYVDYGYKWQDGFMSMLEPFTGASESEVGISGLVPAPSAGAATRYLRSDGTWQVPLNVNTVITAGDGAAYTATVPGITALTAGISFIMIPHVVSTSTSPTLDVNGLGAKNIKRRLTSLATAAQPGYTAAWLAKGLPFRVIYDGTQWIVEGHDKPAGADLYGAAAKATADANGNVITDTYATITALQDMLPKISTITLGTTWEGAGPYYQDVALSYVTEEYIVDLQPSVEQIVSWQENGYAFTTLSGTGSVRVYAIGNLPSESISIQTKAQKVMLVP